MGATPEPTVAVAAAAAPDAAADGEPAARSAFAAAPIVFDLPAVKTAADALSESVAARRLQHEHRAKKFGVPVRPVRETTVLGARRAAVRTGFVTGFDVTSAAELARRQKRAERFGAVAAAAAAAPGADAAEAEAAAAAAAAAAAEAEAVAADALERRREAVPGEEVRASTVHVFGVDDLSTAEVRRHFAAYGPSWVEWVNDSSCNVAFEDAFSAARVLRFCAAEEPSAAPAGDAMGDGADDGLSAPVAPDGAVRDPRLEWREAKPIKGADARFVLWMRIATDRDKRPERPNPDSRWSRTVRRDAGRRDGADDRMTDQEEQPVRRGRRRRRGGRGSRNDGGGVAADRVRKPERREARGGKREGRRAKAESKEESRMEEEERRGKYVLDIDKPLSSR